MNFFQNKFLVLFLILAVGLFSFHFAYAGDVLKIIGAVILAAVAVTAFILAAPASLMAAFVNTAIGSSLTAMAGAVFSVLPAVGVIANAAIGVTLICAGGATSGEGICANVAPTVVVSAPAVPGQACAGAVPVVFYNVNPNTEMTGGTIMYCSNCARYETVNGVRQCKVCKTWSYSNNLKTVPTDDAIYEGNDTNVNIYRFAASPVPTDPANFVFNTPKLSSGSGILNINSLATAVSPSSMFFNSSNSAYLSNIGTEATPWMTIKYKDFCFANKDTGKIACNVIDQSVATSTLYAYVAKIDRPYQYVDSTTIKATRSSPSRVVYTQRNGNGKFLSTDPNVTPVWPYLYQAAQFGVNHCSLWVGNSSPECGYWSGPTYNYGPNIGTAAAFRQTPADWSCPLSAVDITTTTCTSATLNVKINNPAGTSYQLYRILQKDYVAPTVADPGNPSAGIAATVASPGNIGSLIATLPISQASYTDNNLTPHTKYMYTAKVMVNVDGGTKEEAITTVGYTFCPPQGCTFRANPTTVLNFPADSKLSWKCASGADSCKIDSNATGAAANAPTNFTPDFSVGGIMGHLWGGGLGISKKQWVAGALDKLPTSGGVSVEGLEKATDYVLTCSNVDGQVQYKASVSLKKPGIQEVKPQ